MVLAVGMKLVHRVDDKPFDGLRSEHPCEFGEQAFPNLVDEVLLVVRKVGQLSSSHCPSPFVCFELNGT